MPIDVCRICFTKTGGGQKRHEHNIKCYRRTRCDMCKMNIYELYPKAPSIRNFTTHTILCIGHGLHKCFNCSEHYTKFSQAYEHYKKCEKNVVCFACNKRPFAMPKLLQEHNAKKHQPFQCQVCDEIFMTQGNLDLHSVTHK